MKLPGRRCARGRPALLIHSRSSLRHSALLTGRAVAEKEGQRGGRDAVISEQEQAEHSVILAFSHHLGFYYFKKNSTTLGQIKI